MSAPLTHTLSSDDWRQGLARARARGATRRLRLADAIDRNRRRVRVRPAVHAWVRRHLALWSEGLVDDLVELVLDLGGGRQADVYPEWACKPAPTEKHT